MQPLLHWKSITYSQCVFITVALQHALCMYGLPGSTVFFHINGPRYVPKYGNRDASVSTAVVCPFVFRGHRFDKS
jgi:hypothetical protein